MSKFKRDLENANSALLVNITASDFEGTNPLSGIYFQRELEQKAYKIAGSCGRAPCQMVKDFMDKRISTTFGKVKPTYLPGVTLSNFWDILPEFVCTTLKEALLYFDDKMNGFATLDPILTGVETRSSSPVRIVRNDKFMSLTVDGIYPCGEGAGYAGGIMSAAADGINVARALILNNS